jgi:hypothetical protein
VISELFKKFVNPPEDNTRESVQNEHTELPVQSQDYFLLPQKGKIVRVIA